MIWTGKPPRVRVLGVERFDHTRPRNVYAIDQRAGAMRLLVASDEGRLRWIAVGRCIVAGYTEAGWAWRTDGR